MKTKKLIAAIAICGVTFGVSVLPALADDPVENVDKEIYTAADSTLQAWANEKTASHSAKPYIATLHPTSGGAEAPGNSYGVFGEGFVSADPSDTTDAKMGMLSFDLENLNEAPQAAYLDLTYIGHRILQAGGDATAHVGATLVDTSKCTDSAPACGTDVATWAKRPDFTVDDANTAYAEEFDARVADLYTSDSMTIPADKRKDVRIDVTDLVAKAFEGDARLVTFVVGETNNVELRFASSEGAGGMLRGLSAADAPKLTVTVPDTPAPGVPEGPRAWEDKTESMTGHDVLWYKQPATQTADGNVGAGANISGVHNKWQRTTLPIGNGKVGGTVWGEIGEEKITFNEETLWTGGPAQGRQYNGGNEEGRGRNGAALRELNAELASGKTTVANPGALTGGFNAASQGSYQNWGDLRIKSLDQMPADVNFYERSLDLSTGVASVHFNANDTDYMRDYFVSNPDNVMVARLDAVGAKKLNLDVTLPLNPGWSRASEQISVADGKLTSSGVLGNNGLLYNAQIKAVVEGEGASTSNADGALRVSGATGVTLYISAATDYKQVHPGYRTGESAAELDARVAKTVEDAAAKGYDAVLDAHVKDHSGLYDRVSVDLGQSPTYGEGALPTDDLLYRYKIDNANRAQQRALEMLIYDYGRYLTIASSRENSQLPSNLQGIWSSTADDNAHGATPWGADFHLNVNLQMNYWPTYSSNLSDSALPLIKFTEGLVDPGRVTARVYAGAETPANMPIGEGEGYMAHTENTAYGWTTPGAAFSWGWSPAAVPWILQNVYEYYEYTGDEGVLRDRIYPLLKEEANFYVNYMLHKGNRPDADGEPRLTTGVAYSPEHGPLGTDGNAYESSLVWQLLQDAQEAATALDVDDELVSNDGECSVENWQKDAAGVFTQAGVNRSWNCAQSLLKPIEVGDSGQIKEWFFEGELGKTVDGANIPGYQGNHRHLSHMLGLFPGDLITVDNAEFMDAAKVSLNARGDDATGWGVGQRINSWARTGDGDRALVLINKQLKNAMYPNLFDAHPPFQIDGNFGNTSGVNEMLVQSNSTFKLDDAAYHNYIHLLPALPAKWANGSVDGLKARGNYDLTFDWSDGTVDNVTVHSNLGGEVVLAFEGAARFQSAITEDGVEPITKLDDTHILFNTEAGKSYTLSTETAPEEPTEPTEPSEPSEPSEPTEPTEPSEPSEPTEPTDPSQPSEPTDPAEPSEPTDPSEPAEPTGPSEPSESSEPTEPIEPTDSTDATDPTVIEPSDSGDSGKSDQSSLPKTGVEIGALMVLGLGLGVMGISAVTLRRRRNM